MMRLLVLLEQAKLMYNEKENQGRGCSWMVLGWELIWIDWGET